MSAEITPYAQYSQAYVIDPDLERTRTVEAMMRDLGKRSGVENVHPHRFRRTFATNKLRRGMKLEEIQQLLGHTNIETTLIYAKLDHDLLKVNARRLA